MTDRNEQVNMQSYEAYIANAKASIDEAVQAVGAEAGVDPLVIFAEPNEVRRDDKGLELSEQQEAELREIAGRFGIGGEKDISSNADYRIIEGGLAWKVAAEVAISVESPSTLVFTGSPNRFINRADEVAFLDEVLPNGSEGIDTEYDMVRSLAEQMLGFEANEEDEVLPFGYEVSSEFGIVTEPTGQLVKIGELNGQDIVMLRVDREDYVDEGGNNKYRNQPDGAALMGVVADVLSEIGDSSSSVGLVTSNTYASRAVDVLRAGVSRNRQFDVGMYGRETLADAKGEEVAAPTEINQIPGELSRIWTKIVALESSL